MQDQLVSQTMRATGTVLYHIYHKLSTHPSLRAFPHGQYLLLRQWLDRKHDGGWPGGDLYSRQFSMFVGYECHKC
jgi:hypothetical protein